MEEIGELPPELLHRIFQQKKWSDAVSPASKEK
jgi:hypothetical protein